MDIIPGKYEALCRAYTMRDLRDEGASIALIAIFFAYAPHDVETIIRWHEKLYPVKPDRDEVGYPSLLDHFRLKKPP
jgi:hypothetical protein